MNNRYWKYRVKKSKKRKQVLQTPNEERKNSYVSVRNKTSIQREREKKKEKDGEAIHVQSEPRSCGWGATHLRAASFTKLPTERGSKWVCAGREKRKQKAERHERDWEERKGRITLAVTLWPGGSAINAENIQVKKKKKLYIYIYVS